MTKRIINEVSNDFDNEPTRNLKISEYSEAESKDLILEVLLKYPNREAEISDFKRILFPKDTNDDIKYLLMLISEYIPEIVKTNISRYEIGLKTNERTKSFLENGGFTKIDSDEIQNKKKKLSREIKQDKILDLELKLKTFESKIGKKIIIAGFIITFLSFLITVLTLEFWQTDESKNEQKNQVENLILNKKEVKLKDSLN